MKTVRVCGPGGPYETVKRIYLERFPMKKLIDINNLEPFDVFLRLVSCDMYDFVGYLSHLFKGQPELLRGVILFKPPDPFKASGSLGQFSTLS